MKARFDEVSRSLIETEEAIAGTFCVRTRASIKQTLLIIKRFSGVEKERDFYFTKLRKIEILCQDNEQEARMDVAKVFEILYETEDGFAPPEDADQQEQQNDVA